MASKVDLESEILDLRKRIELLENKEAIRDVLSKYSFSVDSDQIDEAVKFWSENSVFASDATGNMETYRGREGIKSFLSYAANNFKSGHQHLQLDYVIRVEGHKAFTVGYQIITTSDPKTITIDRAGFRYFGLEKQDGKWLITESVSHVITEKEACRNLLKKMKGD